MAELHDLSPVEGSRRNRKRVGRGPGSGTGKTSGRGQKGAGARSGTTTKPGFEGGQMPLYRRIPKRGFTNLNRVEYQVVNVRELEGLEGDLTPESLRAAGRIGSLRKPVKILGEGEVARALHVSAHAFSRTAREKIEAAGGTVTVIGQDEVAAATSAEGEADETLDAADEA